MRLRNHSVPGTGGRYFMKNLRIGIWMLAVCACVLLILTSCGTADPGSAVQEGSNVTRYREKEALLRAQLTGAVLTELGSAPAGEAIAPQG